MATTESLKGRRITGEARSKMAQGIGDRYGKGESIRQIARSLDRSYGFVHRVLGEAGTPLRGRGRGRMTTVT